MGKEYLRFLQLVPSGIGEKEAYVFRLLNVRWRLDCQHVICENAAVELLQPFVHRFSSVYSFCRISELSRIDGTKNLPSRLLNKSLEGGPLAL